MMEEVHDLDTGEVISTSDAAVRLELMEIPPEDRDQPHVFFKRVLMRWTIAAERACGAKWCKSVLIAQLQYFDARVASGADLGRK